MINFNLFRTIVVTFIGITFILVIGSIVFCVSQMDDNNINPMFFPEQARAQAQQKLADEMAEQNRLMREQIKLLQEQKSK